VNLVVLNSTQMDAERLMVHCRMSLAALIIVEFPDVSL